VQTESFVSLKDCWEYDRYCAMTCTVLLIASIFLDSYLSMMQSWTLPVQELCVSCQPFCVQGYSRALYRTCVEEIRWFNNNGKRQMCSLYFML
jgi:hypothetical protein